MPQFKELRLASFINTHSKLHKYSQQADSHREAEVITGTCISLCILCRLLCLMSMSVKTPRSLSYGEKLYPPNPLSTRHAVRHQWTGSSSTNGIGGILHKGSFKTVLSSWYSVKVSCSLAIGWYTFQLTKTINVKLLRVVDDYHNAEYGVALIQCYNYLLSMSHIYDTRCS